MTASAAGGPRALPLLTPHDRTRDSAFSYDCKACGRCCRNKLIRVNPYEVARLAEQLGLTTSEVLARYTEEGGAVLATRGDVCVFFDAEAGCTVHGGRPLVCRLYPLGRHVDHEGGETFAVIAPEPGSEGVYGDAGTIDDYLTSQAVAPFVAATGRYLEALRKLLPQFVARDDAAELAGEAARAARGGTVATEDNLLDVDAVVRRECARLGVAVPPTLEDRVAMHLAFLSRLAEAEG